MSKTDEFINSSGFLEYLPSRVDPALYNYEPGRMIPGMIWYRGSRYTEFKYLLTEKILTLFEFSTERTIWSYDGMKFTEGSVIRNTSMVSQSTLVQILPALSPKFASVFKFDLSVLDRIDDPDVVFVAAELSRAWSQQS